MTHDVSPPASCLSRVAILMCTYQGASFLAEQLESIERQTLADWVLHVSDDGSRDATLPLLEAFRNRHGGRVVLWQGPQRGFAANFMSLLHNPHIQAQYFAFCDQDDIWFPDKLERSVDALERLSGNGARLYGSRTQLIDMEGHDIGLSPLFQRLPGFGNALVQSIAGGNTMLLNDAARQLLTRVPVEMPVVSHDWLAYLLVTGSGGQVVYDRQPTLLYRQHAGNLIGSNLGVMARISRIRRLLSGSFREWTSSNIRILEQCSDVLCADSRQRFELFCSARDSGLVQRLRLLLGAGVYRQTIMGSIGLMVAAVLNRV